MTSTTTTTHPTSLLATTGLELLSFPTGNGQKASIFLEELRLAYPNTLPPYTTQTINIFHNTQKEPWYTALAPNGKIPVLIDHDNGSLAVSEGMVILMYLARRFDREYKFSFERDPERAECEQWMAWQQGGLGPMQGQANHFYRMAPERLPYPTQRFVGETERLWGVLDIRLRDRDYIVGSGRGKYSIADIVQFGYVNVGWYAGIKIEMFPNVERWWKLLSVREGVQRVLKIPGVPYGTKEGHEQKLLDNEEYRQKEEELERALEEAKERYGYVFAAP